MCIYNATVCTIIWHIRAGLFTPCRSEVLEYKENQGRSEYTITNSTTSGPAGCYTQAKLHLVDLAGSERAKRTGALGTRLKESVGINQVGLLQHSDPSTGAPLTMIEQPVLRTRKSFVVSKWLLPLVSIKVDRWVGGGRSG